MKRPAMVSRRPLERGEFSWISALLLIAAVGGAYLGYVWAPVFMDHIEVKQTVRDFMNQAVHQKSDALLLERLCQRLQKVQGRLATDAEGGGTGPVVELAPEDITWERDTEASPPMLHVELSYTRPVYYPFLDRMQEVTLTFEHTQDIAVPKWK